MDSPRPTGSRRGPRGLHHDNPSTWLAAIRAAPAMKSDHHTVLSERDCLPEVRAMIEHDPRLRGCFRP